LFFSRLTATDYCQSVLGGALALIRVNFMRIRRAIVLLRKRRIVASSQHLEPLQEEIWDMVSEEFRRAHPLRQR